MSRDQAAALIAEVFIEGRASAAPLVRHALDCPFLDDRHGHATASHRSAHARIELPPENSGSSTTVRTKSSHAGPETPPAEAWRLESSISTSTYRGFRESARRVRSGVAMLNDWSQGNSPGISEVFALPDALVKDIIRTAPDRPPQPNDYETAAPSEQADAQPANRPRTPTAHTRDFRVDTRSVRPSSRRCQRVGRRRSPRERGHRDGYRRGQDADCAHLRDPLPGPPQRTAAPDRRLSTIRPAHSAVVRRGGEVRRHSHRPKSDDEYQSGTHPAVFEASEPVAPTLSSSRTTSYAHRAFSRRSLRNSTPATVRFRQC